MPATMKPISAAYAGINEGDNLVLLETESREKALEHRFPYIESAKIVKHIPSTIEIEITPPKRRFPSRATRVISM